MEADWSNVRREGDGLWIGLKSEPDTAWRDAFADTERLWRSETRGQTWDAVELSVDGRAVFVSGIDSEETSSDWLRTYVTDLLEAVDRAADRDRSRSDREASEEQRKAVAQSDALDGLAGELRDGS